jgi:hypothetical protein
MRKEVEELRVKALHGREARDQPFGRARDCSGNPAGLAKASPRNWSGKPGFFAQQKKAPLSVLLSLPFRPHSSCVLFFIFFFLWGALLFGQEGDYRIEGDGRFVQTLRWSEEENALYYGVEVEKREGEAWVKAAEGETEAAFFELALGPGIYRYRVRVYDFLRRPAGTSEWAGFEVYLARAPEIARFGPEAFYLDEDVSWTLDLEGRNLDREAEIYLESREAGGGVIRPQGVRLEESENGARLVFGYDQLEVGEYAIRVVNPGGLGTSLGTFRIAFRKPVDINVSAGYRPLVPLYGETNELFGTNFFPLGVYGRLSVVPFKRRWGYMGFELEPAWSYLSARGEGYKVEAQMTGAAAYGLYQYWFENRIMALSVRIGGGLYSVLDYHFTYDRGKSDSMTVLLPAVAGGLSFQWFIAKPFFMEAGADFTHMFAVENPEPGYLRPFVGGGWQF